MKDLRFFSPLTPVSWQFKYIVGFNVKPHSETVYNYVGQYVANAHDFQWQEFIMGMSLLVWLFTFRELGKRFPRTLG